MTDDKLSIRLAFFLAGVFVGLMAAVIIIEIVV